MNWLQDLLTNPNSIAHIVALYAFVIAAGVLLGKIKFFGISLGVTFVLFVGILAGHFGFTGNPAILSFVQDFGLILFVFCIGLQVGPSFFFFVQARGYHAQPAGGGNCVPEYCSSTDSVFCLAGQDRYSDDGRYPLWGGDQHSGTWCG